MTDPHPQRCIHYDACWFVHQHSRCPDDEPTEYEKSLPDCRFDTRTHTPAAPATEPKPLRYSGVTVFTPPELSRHDAATRKAEREQVLDELLVGFKSNKNIICWLKGPTCAFPEITCRNCIIQHLESLRGGATQQGGDRRE